MAQLVPVGYHGRSLFVALGLTLTAATAVAITLPGGDARVASADSGPRGPGGSSCESVDFEVQVLDGPHKMAGTLCRPTGRRAPTATVVFLHGFSYNRAYWDFPVKPSRYSAVRTLASDGHLTLALDWLGAGESDRPPASDLLPDVNTRALHQIVSQMRAQPGARTRSGRVFLVGHSAGTTVAIRAIAQYDDFDGLVATGFLHATGSAPDLFAAMFHPAAQDATFAGDPVPEGYSTSRPGTRRIFYNAFNAEGRVVRADESTKDAISFPFSGFVEERDTGEFAREVDVPVLVQVGAEDLSFCTPPHCPEAKTEHRAYPLSPNFQLDVLQRVGHNVNLHRGATDATERIGRWVDRLSR